MAISLQAHNGTEGNKTIRLRGHLNGREIFMLIDSGSSHSFLNEQVATYIAPWETLPYPTVQVANGEVLQCTYHLPKQLWGVQGQHSEQH